MDLSLCLSHIFVCFFFKFLISIQLMYTNYRQCSFNRLHLNVGIKVNMSEFAVLWVGLFWSYLFLFLILDEMPSSEM